MTPKGGMQNLLKQARKMQENIQKAQEELASVEVEGSSGGGIITVKVNGKLEVTSIKIDPEILGEDIEMVEDMILAAVNQGIQKAQEFVQKKMGEAAGGILPNLPKGFNIPGL